MNYQKSVIRIKRIKTGWFDNNFMIATLKF